MTKLSGEKEIFIVKDLDRPGALVAVYCEDWLFGRPVLPGWRGPRADSEDFARGRLEPYIPGKKEENRDAEKS